MRHSFVNPVRRRNLADETNLNEDGIVSSARILLRFMRDSQSQCRVFLVEEKSTTKKLELEAANDSLADLTTAAHAFPHADEFLWLVEIWNPVVAHPAREKI